MIYFKPRKGRQKPDYLFKARFGDIKVKRSVNPNNIDPATTYMGRYPIMSEIHPNIGEPNPIPASKSDMYNASEKLLCRCPRKSII